MAPAKPRTGTSMELCFLHSCRNLSRERERLGSDGCVASSKDVERIPWHCFSPLVINQFLSGLIGVFFCTYDTFHIRIRNACSEQVCVCVWGCGGVGVWVCGGGNCRRQARCRERGITLHYIALRDMK